MDNKADSLLVKFAIVFTLFLFVALSLSGISAYISQRAIYKTQCEKRLVHIARHLENLVRAEGQLFADFTRYFVRHKDDIRVPLDYDGNWKPFWEAFEKFFQSRYPGKTLGVDLRFSDMDEECQMACAIYMHRKWLAIFESVPRDFGIHYAYYLMPSPKPLHMYWVIDAVREEKIIDGMKCINLCTEVLEPLEEHQKMWQAWNSGSAAMGYDTYDNQFGKTYAYYTAVHLDGEKTGVIGTEIDIADVDAAILRNALIQTIGIGVVLVACMAVLLLFIYRKYIRKLERLQASVRQYAESKDPGIVAAIEGIAMGKDEISALSMQTAAMILEIENYMKRLKDASFALVREKERADALHALANKDALTDIRNKMAYDKESKRLEWAIEDKSACFGIAVIDQNHLKQINDLYGHEQGNVSIKKLCRIVCTVFKHSPVYRVGGDEFAVILEHSDLENVQALSNQFNAILEDLCNDAKLKPWEKVSAAIGIAIFDPALDDSVASVFKRADKDMYARKKAMKAGR